MGFDRGLGLAGLAVGVIGIAITILWPDKKWVGWLFLIAGFVILVFWGVNELKHRIANKNLSLIASIALGCVLGGAAAFLVWKSASEKVGGESDKSKAQNHERALAGTSFGPTMPSPEITERYTNQSPQAMDRRPPAGTRHAPKKPLPPGTYMSSWGIQSGFPPGTQMVVNGDGEIISGPKASEIIAAGYLLGDYADHYRLLGVCFHWDGLVDFKEQKGILKGAAMDIAPYPISMLIRWTPSFVKEMPRAKATNYALLLVPKTLDVTSIDSISDALSHGAFLIGTGGGPPGGFGEFKEIPPPMAPE